MSRAKIVLINIQNVTQKQKQRKKKNSVIMSLAGAQK